MTENKRFYVDKSGDFRDNKTGVTIVDFGYNFNGIECRQILELMNSLNDENEQLKKDKFICLDCEHSGYVEIGCLCEYNDHWVDFKSKCEDFKELRL